MRRTFIGLAASTVAAGALLFTVTGGTAFAGAPGPKPVKVTCSTLSGNVGGSPSGPTISGCSQTQVTGGSATFTFPAAPSGTITINWQAGGTTTAAFSSTVLPNTTKADKCPADPTASPPNSVKQTEVILHGSVQPPGNGGVKGALAAKLCLTSALDLSLAKGQFKV